MEAAASRQRAPGTTAASETACTDVRGTFLRCRRRERICCCCPWSDVCKAAARFGAHALGKGPANEAATPTTKEKAVKLKREGSNTRSHDKKPWSM